MENDQHLVSLGWFRVRDRVVKPLVSIMMMDTCVETVAGTGRERLSFEQLKAQDLEPLELCLKLHVSISHLNNLPNTFSI